MLHIPIKIIFQIQIKSTERLYLLISIMQWNDRKLVKFYQLKPRRLQPTFCIYWWIFECGQNFLDYFTTCSYKYSRLTLHKTKTRYFLHLNIRKIQDSRSSMEHSNTPLVRRKLEAQSPRSHNASLRIQIQK